MPRSSRMAQLLLALMLLQFALLVGWVAWRAPAAPVQAAVGAAVIAFFPAWVLAVEFVLLAVVRDDDGGVPRPTAWQLAKAWLEESVDLYRIFYWRLPFRWRDPPDLLDAGCRGRRGAVLVHGFVCNRGFWAPWMQALRRAGHPCVAVNLEPVFTSIDHYADLIEDAVGKVEACAGMPPVLVCHSMGGLAARAWLRRDGNGARVAHVITIASPHHGTWLGRFSTMPNGRQMRLRSDWLRELQRHEAGRPAPPWTCWYSNADNIVFPVGTATLPHARNHHLPGWPHVSLAFAPEVMRDGLDRITAQGGDLSR